MQKYVTIRHLEVLDKVGCVLMCEYAVSVHGRDKKKKSMKALILTWLHPYQVLDSSREPLLPGVIPYNLDLCTASLISFDSVAYCSALSSFCSPFSFDILTPDFQGQCDI